MYFSPGEGDTAARERERVDDTERRMDREMERGREDRARHKETIRLKRQSKLRVEQLRGDGSHAASGAPPLNTLVTFKLK